MINHGYVTAIVPTSTHTFTGGRIASHAPNTCQSKPPYNQSYVELRNLFHLCQVDKWLLRHTSRSCVTGVKSVFTSTRTTTPGNRYTLFSRHVLVQYTCSLELVALRTSGHGRAAKANTCACASRWVSSSSLHLPSSGRSFLARKSRASFAIDRSISCRDKRFGLRFYCIRKAELICDRSISCRDTTHLDCDWTAEAELGFGEEFASFFLGLWSSIIWNYHHGEHQLQEIVGFVPAAGIGGRAFCLWRRQGWGGEHCRQGEGCGGARCSWFMDWLGEGEARYRTQVRKIW